MLSVVFKGTYVAFYIQHIYFCNADLIATATSSNGMSSLKLGRMFFILLMASEKHFCSQSLSTFAQTAVQRLCWC